MADVAELLGMVRPKIQGNPQPQYVVPHVYSFSSLINSASQTYSYRWDEALRRMPSDALAMRRDAFVTSLLQERYVPTSQRNWSIKVPNRNDTYQKHVAQCVTNAIRAIPRFNALRYNLLEAIWYGRYGSQLNWVQKRIDGKTAWTVGKHQPVNGDKIFHNWDGTPCVAINPLTKSAYGEGLLTTYSDRGMALLRLERPEHRRQFIIHKHICTDADYFEPEMGGGINGLGIRSQMYWAWWLREEMLSWAVDFMQKVGTLGLLIFMYEEGNSASEEKATSAAQKASTEVALTMAMPPGANTRATNGVQHIPPNDAGITALRGMIEDYFETHIVRLIIGQPSSGASSGNGFGGSAGMALHADTKFQLLKFDANNLDETVSEDLVKVIVELNHSDVDFPVEFVSSVPNPEDAAKLQAVQTFVEMGGRVKEDEARDLTGMSKPEEDDEILESKPEPSPFGGGGFPGQENDANPENPERTPGQKMTTNSKVKRDEGDQFFEYSPLYAYADDGSIFEDYVETDGGMVVTLARKGKEGLGVPVTIPRGKGERAMVAAIFSASDSISLPQATKLVREFVSRAL